MSSQSRQLAAIMFTDIVGYTALMERNEQRAFQLLDENRKIQRPLIIKFNGKWLKEIGDGILASFNTVSDAVYCAGAIQKACENNPALSIRIGIHDGEVVFKDEDVFGSGVNIASRLESIAPVGGILVSESVYRNIKNKEGIEVEFLREETLKNVDEPIKIYQVNVAKDEPPENAPNSSESPPRLAHKKGVIIGAVVIILMLLGYVGYQYRSNEPPINGPMVAESEINKSIAVLPFANMSNDPEQQYFSDGIMEAILNDLTTIGELKVISRTSVMQYRNTEKTSPEIAEELGVAYLLEGGVQAFGGKVRVNAQLIDAVQDKHIWSENYDRELADIFAIQSEVAQKIASQLKAVLTSEEFEQIDKQRTDNLEAYNLYLKGRFFWNRRKEEDLKTSIHYFEKATALDPNYALAYAGLADAYYIMAGWGWYDKDKGFKLGKELARKALSIDDKIAAAYATLGATAFWYEWDWGYAEKELKKAIDLDPNYATAYLYYAILLDILGRKEEAREQINLALKFNPYSGIILNISSLIYYNNHEFSKSVDHLDKSVEISGEPIHAYYLRNYLRRGENHLAIQQVKAVLNENVNGIEIDSVSQKEGVKGVINLYSDSLLFDVKGHYYHLAALSCLVDNPKKALDYLEKSYENRKLYLPRMKHCIDFELVANHPRFVALVEKMNL